MTKVSLTSSYPMSAEDIWKLIGRFNSLPDWHPAVAKCEIEREGNATLRRLTLVGGGEILERLEASDDDEHLYTYSILESPLPVANYTATLKVSENEAGGCTIEWSSEFEPKGAAESEAVEAIEGIYRAGFENLRKMFSG